MGLYIYDDDDPSMSDGCVHTLDLRLTNDPFHLDGCAHSVIFSHNPFYLDGCFHIMDSCFDIRYVYVYASLISRSPDTICSYPFKSL